MGMGREFLGGRGGTEKMEGTRRWGERMKTFVCRAAWYSA
jgi:hypothetical protein